MSTIHHNGTSKKINKSEIEPQEKPQGIWIPMAIWEMTNDGKLSFLDLRLLMRINSYVTAKGAGCWASNGRLAEETGVTRNHAATRIAFLKSLGLVIEVGTVTIGNLKRKLLETSWSCVFPGQQDPKLKRKAVRDAVRETLTKKNTQITVTLYKREVTYTTDRIATYTTDRIATYTIDRIQSSNERKSIKKHSRRSADDSVKSLFIGELSEGFLSEEKDSSRQADEKRATRLRKAMKECFYDGTQSDHRKNFIPHADDYKQIEKIRNDPEYAGTDIDTLIDDYIEIMGQPFVPETHTIKTFREKLDSIISAVNKSKRGNVKSVAPSDNGKTYTGE